MENRRVQRNIATLVAVFGFCAFAVNFTVGLTLRGDTLVETLATPSVFSTLAFAVAFAVTRSVNHLSVRLFHVVSIIVVAALAILDVYESFYGLGFMTLAALLSYKYGFLNRGLWWKLSIGMALVIALVEISVFRSHDNLVGVSIAVILYLVFFVLFLLFVYRDDLDRLSSSNRRLERSLSELITDKSRVERELQQATDLLEEYEQTIQNALNAAQSRVDEFRTEYSLTKKELEIVIIVYETGKSNQDIADDLGISVGTVKQHLSRIYAKVDVRNRTQMLTIMRDYLTETAPSDRHPLPDG